MRIETIGLLLGLIVSSDAFTPSRRFQQNVKHKISPVNRHSVAAQSHLFSHRSNPLTAKRRAVQRGFFSNQPTAFKRILSRCQKAFAVLSAALFLWMGTATFNTQPAHASTASLSADRVIERVMTATSRSKQEIIDRYIKDHMFDDEIYDPVESLYREAYEDATKGTHPRALKDVVSSVLGSEGAVKSREGSSGIGSLLTSSIATLQKRGLSETAAITVLAALFVVAGPSIFLFVGMIIGGISKRNMNKLMKSRYGESYTVDATIKDPEDVEAPDDEDDSDDEDDGDSDDEDDEDE